MSREQPNYVSMMKVHGHPILPPLVSDAERPVLQQYREEAVWVESELERKKKERLERQATTNVEPMCGSIVSNDDSDQVMKFICQALKDSSHLEEVQQLQLAIFEELQKYQGSSTSFREDDSMDTMHNIEDFSNTVGSSREVSPTKSLPSENWPSPKLNTEHLKVPSAALHDAASHDDMVWREGGMNRSHDAGTLSPVLADLVEPRMSLSYPSTPVTPGHVDPDQIPPNHVLNCDNESNADGGKTPPKLIRRNSYTLDSPSPSVLLYLKNLNVNESAIVPQDSAAKRNLNRVWSDVLSLDARSNTPMNLSATSWRSESNEPSLSELPSVRNNEIPRLDDNSTANQNDSRTSNNNRIPQNVKKSYVNNNVSLDGAAAKIQAAVRGYLTRRLLRTGRVVDLKNAIKDSLITALQMHTDTTVSKAELELHRQLTLQIESLVDEWHQIFFEFSPQERMRIIQVDRNKPKNPKPKKPFLRKSKSRTSMETSGSSIEQLSTASRPKSLPLTKSSSSPTAHYKPWK